MSSSREAEPATTPTSAVTLVVALYNHGSYVERALHSAFEQDAIGYRVIITDDASTDDTQERVLALMARNSWHALTIFHKENRGICATFNEALAQVRTPYVAFISGDDWQARHRLRTLARALDETPDAALAYTDMCVADASGELTGDLYSADFAGGWEGEKVQDRELFLSLVTRQWIPTPSVMSRTDALLAVGGYNERLEFEDWDMWLKLARNYPFVFVDEPLVYYRVHNASLNHEIARGPIIRRWNSAYEIFEPHLGQDPRVDLVLIPRMYRMARAAFFRGDSSSSVRAAFKRHARMSNDPQAWCLWALASLGIPIWPAWKISSSLRAIRGRARARFHH